MRARPYGELRVLMSPAARAESKARADALLEKLRLREIREAKERTQQSLADAMGIPQSAVSKMERRRDVYVSTLRKYVRAMGGDLEIIATFPDGGRVKVDLLKSFERKGRIKGRVSRRAP